MCKTSTTPNIKIFEIWVVTASENAALSLNRRRCTMGSIDVTSERLWSADNLTFSLNIFGLGKFDVGLCAAVQCFRLSTVRLHTGFWSRAINNVQNDLHTQGVRGHCRSTRGLARLVRTTATMKVRVPIENSTNTCNRQNRDFE